MLCEACRAPGAKRIPAGRGWRLGWDFWWFFLLLLL